MAATISGLHVTEVNIKFANFINSEHKTGLIWAPTQVGKSEAINKFIETCFRCDAPVIVSTDNKIDQCEQLFTRVSRMQCGDDTNILRVSDRRFVDDLQKIVQSGNKRFVIFCMNNASQITKLIGAFRMIVGGNKAMVGAFRSITRMAVVHDEADMVTKDACVDERTGTQPASHAAWIDFQDMFEERITHISLKRMFVSATPENCCLLYKIPSEAVFALAIPETYTGYKDIHYVSMNDGMDIYHTLVSEVNRVKECETHEVILYCIERNIDMGHNAVLQRMHDNLDCTVSTYNGRGLTVMFKTEEMCEDFEAVLEKYSENKKGVDPKAKAVKFTRNDLVFVLPDLPVCDFYTMCKAVGERCVVTIGRDLIARGISYVGRDRKQPLTATTMIYKPGQSMHAVGIVQTVGRITGCAMPCLKRRLYAPSDVITTYKAFNANQEKYIAEIQKSVETINVRNIIDGLEFCKLKRKIDRPKLKLRMNMTHEYESESESDEESDNEGESETGIDVADNKVNMLATKWWHATSFIGKIMRWLYSKPRGACHDELIQFLESEGSNNPLYMSKYLTRADKDMHLVFQKIGDIYDLTSRAREAIASSIC
jgi:hypothetical protein